MPDLDGLLRGVLERPDDDAARLVYADALEEAGLALDAAYIRCETALDGLPPCRCDRGRKQQAEEAGEPCCETDRLDTLADRCMPTLYRDPLGRCLRAIVGPDARDRHWGWHWRRGFVVSAACPAAEWLAHGPALCGKHPVELLVLTDAIEWVSFRAEPVAGGIPVGGSPDYRDFEIGPSVALAGGREVWPRAPGRGDEAKATYAANALDWARGVNGLPARGLPPLARATAVGGVAG